ncbi:hypothetical protein GCM10008107_31470 [Psychrosphaera saromensis]|uniref:DUF304 domain-containing protein n=1 Tax=Psychrosphaera saromensis TaxID=716813 RepID=A0A2S7UWG8_9GAMM|nr:hypothetical protein [Psychrosphaera saromensis]PQJ54119.1 hypothetical protein BTO11_10955 [Psychrosphaera saromensis]GHB79760.1 hypothetical protein GCM10008107_31470 [Psychrosphaera saromensis]GLQ12759.1 hypothetical protein GCM10007917_02140 [Psychrosphaera saromensis]
MKYNVLWINIWKKLTKFMSLAISIPVSFVFVIRFFKNDMSVEKTFEHITLIQLPLFFLGIIAFSAFFSFLIAILIRLAAVEIQDGNLIGRNYWYFKKTIPIHAISQFYPFSNNGIEAIVADAGVHGKVYISTQTENLDELLEYLEEGSGAGNA